MAASREFLCIKLLIGQRRGNNLYIVMVKLIELLLSIFLKKTSGNPQPIAEKNPEPLIKTEELKVLTNKPIRHLNNGKCPKCEQIFNKYPGFHQGLKDWFQKVQVNNPEAHISGGGRGKLEQEEYFQKKTSKAHYGQSAHNANSACDIFKLHDNGAEWPKLWFAAVIKPAIDSHNAAATFKIKWYGAPGSAFYELPHIEVENWRELLKNNRIQLVEPL